MHKLYVEKVGTPSHLECMKQNKKIDGLKCKQKYTKVIFLNITTNLSKHELALFGRRAGPS
jgi:hypothetical protein